MKYLAASVLIAGAAAQSFDVATAVNNLITATNALKADVDAYTGGPGEKLRSDATALVQRITEDDASIKASTPLSQEQALGLAGPVQSLGTAAKSVIDALVAKKPTFVSSGQAAAVYSALTAQASASNQFSADLVKLVPEGLQGIAGNLAAPISSALASGVSAFADVASATGSSGASATGSSAESSTSAASSAGPSSTSAASSAEPTSSAAVVAASGNATVPTLASPTLASPTLASPTGASPSSTVVIGAANKVLVGSGVAALAFLAALAL